MRGFTFYFSMVAIITVTGILLGLTVIDRGIIMGMKEQTNYYTARALATLAVRRKENGKLVTNKGTVEVQDDGVTVRLREGLVIRFKR